MAKIRKFGKGGATPKVVQKTVQDAKTKAAEKEAAIKGFSEQIKQFNDSKKITSDARTPNKPVSNKVVKIPEFKPSDTSKPAGTSRTSGPIAKDPEPLPRVTKPAPTVSKPVSDKPKSIGVTPPASNPNSSRFNDVFDGKPTVKNMPAVAAKGMEAVAAGKGMLENTAPRNDRFVTPPRPGTTVNAPTPGFVSGAAAKKDLAQPSARTMPGGLKQMKKGGKASAYKSGGSVSSASKRGDGIAQRGKTRGKMC